jgi:hypothetical protein
LSLPRAFTLERIGGRRRAVVETGGSALLLCAFLGPGEGAVDLLDPGGAVAARIRGGTMPLRAYHAETAAGERLRVHGAAPRIAVESDRRAATEVAVAEEGGGWRALAWRRDAAVAGVLRLVPLDGAVPWTLEVPGWEDPVGALVVLLAAERLLREEESSARGMEG